MQQLCLALVSNICPSFSFFSDSIYLMLWKFLSFNIKEKATEGMLKVLCQYWRKIHLTAQMYSAWETRFMRYSEYSEYSLFFFHCAMIDASRYRISLKTFYLSALEASCIAVRNWRSPAWIFQQLFKKQNGASMYQNIFPFANKTIYQPLI